MPDIEFQLYKWALFFLNHRIFSFNWNVSLGIIILFRYLKRFYIILSVLWKTFLFWPSVTHWRNVIGPTDWTKLDVMTYSVEKKRFKCFQTVCPTLFCKSFFFSRYFNRLVSCWCYLTTWSSIKDYYYPRHLFSSNTDSLSSKNWQLLVV